MSDFLLETGRQTLMLELQEASRLPERLGDDFVRAANTIIQCEGKVIVAGIGKSGHIGKKIAATLASTGTPAASTISRSSSVPVKRVLITSAPSSTAMRAEAAITAGLLESSLVTG